MNTKLAAIQAEINTLLDAVIAGRPIQWQQKLLNKEIPDPAGWNTPIDQGTEYYSTGRFLKDWHLYWWRVKPGPVAPKELFVNIYPNATATTAWYDSAMMNANGIGSGRICRARYVLAEEFDYASPAQR